MSVIRLIAARLEAYRKWSGKVTREINRKHQESGQGWKPPDGFYKTETPERISQQLLQHYDFDKAMRQVNFVDNRSGRKRPPSDREKLDKAKDLLRKKKPKKPGESIVTPPPTTVTTPKSTAKTPKSTARTPGTTATKPKSYA